MKNSAGLGGCYPPRPRWLLPRPKPSVLCSWRLVESNACSYWFIILWSRNDLLRNELNIFWCDSQHLNRTCPSRWQGLQFIAYPALVLTFPQHNTYLRCPEGMEKNLTFSSSGNFSIFLCFWVLVVQLKAQQQCFTVSRVFVDLFLPRISLTLVGFYATRPSAVGNMKLGYMSLAFPLYRDRLLWLLLAILLYTKLQLYNKTPKCLSLTVCQRIRQWLVTSVLSYRWSLV